MLDLLEKVTDKGRLNWVQERSELEVRYFVWILGVKVTVWQGHVLLEEKLEDDNFIALKEYVVDTDSVRKSILDYEQKCRKETLKNIKQALRQKLECYTL